MDINQPITNTRLLHIVNTMRQTATNDPEFFGELSYAKLLCPIQKMRSSSSGNDYTIVLRIVSNQENEYFLIAFTDWDEANKYMQNNNSQMLMLTYADYKKIIMHKNSIYAGLVINPNGANIVITRNILNNVAACSDEVILKTNDSVMVGIPKDYPVDMVKKLKESFKQVKTVKSAYLLWMSKNQETSYLLILDAGGNEKEVFPMIERVCRPYLNDKLLDIVPFNAKLGQEATKGLKPFYKR